MSKESEKFESQAAQMGHYFERIMIHLVETQHRSGGLEDLNKQESNLVYHLGERGASIMRELADGLRLHVSTMTGIVDKLTEKGIVVRERTENDRRVVRVKLTEKGEQAYRSEAVKRRELSLALLEPLDEDERAALLRIFSKVIASLK